MGKSIHEASWTLSPQTCEGSQGTISSPESEFGTLPSDWLIGPNSDPFLQDRARANLSARRARAAGLLTSGTYGPHFSISSASAALQRSLENRLQARTASRGSTLFALIWKARATPSGRLICALRASALRTPGSGYGSWRTPRMNDYKGGLSPTGNNRRNPADYFLPDQVTMLVFGQIPTGCPAETAKPGQLNPAHSRWLMGLPPVWDDCAVTAMQSMPKQRRRSSKA